MSDKESDGEDSGETMLGNTTNVPDAFIFCPNIGIIQMDKLLEQGIFISESEMSQLEGTKNYIFNKFTTIMFEEEDSIKSKLQVVQEYFKDVELK